MSRGEGKVAARWTEVAFDPLRVQRCGLKWPSTSWEWTKRSSMQNVRGLLLLFEHRRGHHGAAQVANVPTWIVQSANLEHMNSYFRCQMRSGRRVIVSFSVGKLMNQRFWHDVSIEIVMQGTGAHKRGPTWPRVRIVQGLLLVFEHKRCPQGGFWDPVRLKLCNRTSG